ncbi:arylsulfatase A-like enzyme [Mariniflexile fucanivorans]|uniref:Arylsulfatase A-like enzyme n=1 Tax=Mariniflexile fucanivorans TaxID=264023 RepID=A0A4R1RLA5_9FLAO|nr:sulfatase [Mariniflexile fucanivorans]TCL66819.1 arylsulfatase A-like enzyme [Mariniflexile fucanivorans]
MKTKLYFLISLCLIGSQSFSQKKTNSKPNFVIIFTDDQGYGDLSCFGGEHVYTPNIDKMAKEGAKLTSFYVAAPLCTPSRAALMTGCYPRRVSMEPPSSLAVELPNITNGRRFPVCLAADGNGLNPDEITIAEIAQSMGYRTGIFGKWHLGDQPEFLPTKQGFEAFFGLPYSHDIAPSHPRQDLFKFPPLPLLEGEKVIEMNPDPNYLTRRITEKAVKFIKDHKDENFFLYVPHPIPHGPLAASSEIKEKYAQELAKGKKGSPELYSTAIYEIDWSVGEILSALKEQDIDENTIVLFTSDNGPAGRNGSAKPLSGHKGQTLEGGMRMPTVIRWTRKIKAGIEIDQLLTTMDLLPTIANLIGAKIPKDRIIDGKNILPVLLEGAKSPHEYFFYSHWGTLEAVRWKYWKLRIIDGNESLYNLKIDIAEKKNLKNQYPDIVVQLKNAMQKFDSEVTKNARPVGHVENPIALTLK